MYLALISIGNPSLMVKLCVFVRLLYMFTKAVSRSAGFLNVSPHLVPACVTL